MTDTGSVLLVTAASDYSSSYHAGQIAGRVLLIVLAVWLVQRALRTPEPPRMHRSVPAMVIAAVVAVFAVSANVSPLVHSDDAHAYDWNSPRGQQTRAEFIAGCTSSAGGRVDCGCLFQQLTAVDKYSSPSGLSALGRDVDVAVQRNDVNLLPRDYVKAARTCIQA